MAYYKRYIERQIKEALDTSGAVVIAGPKFCGKTTTSRLFAKSEYDLDTKDKIELVQSSPRAILEGDAPRLIDEWQNVPDLWNYARSEVDRREDKFGQFIFTGSSTPADMDDIYHSGAGRIVTIPMRTMSLFESEESKGLVSVRDLLQRSSISMKSIRCKIQHFIFAAADGRWRLLVTGTRRLGLPRIITPPYSNSKTIEIKSSVTKRKRFFSCCSKVMPEIFLQRLEKAL